MLCQSGRVADLNSLPSWDLVTSFRELRNDIIHRVCLEWSKSPNMFPQDRSFRLILDGARPASIDEQTAGFVPVQLRFQLGEVQVQALPEFRNFHCEADQAVLFYAARLQPQVNRVLIVSDDTDVFLGVLLHAPTFRHIQWETASGGKAAVRANITDLYARITNDAAFAVLTHKVPSLIFALLLSGNDLSGGLAGIGAQSFLNGFMLRPVNMFFVAPQVGQKPAAFLLPEAPQYSPHLPAFTEVMKQVYFVKNRATLRPFVIAPIRSVSQFALMSRMRC